MALSAGTVSYDGTTGNVTGSGLARALYDSFGSAYTNTHSGGSGDAGCWPRLSHAERAALC